MPELNKKMIIKSKPSSYDYSKSILIADDDRNILEPIQVLFNKYGFMVFKAKDGLKAWDLFNMENIDVVLTDILRPDSNVKELCRRIRNHSPLVKIALMAYGGAVDAEKLQNDGTADYYSPRPFNIKNICRILIAETQVA
jgi:DNA-binding response OmpR family regulator